MRLVTRQAKQMAGGASPAHARSERTTGLTIRSADAVRFAYTATPLPVSQSEEFQEADDSGDDPKES